MDKINNVSFKGISNIGICEFSRGEDCLSKSISMILKDDIKGKDLTEFKSVLKKITDNTSNYINEETPNLLNIEAFSQANQNGGMIVNGTFLEFCDKNLPMFSYIAKMTRRISKMPDKEMIINDDYIALKAKNNLIVGGELICNNVEQLKRFFERSTVKTVADEINGFIQLLMDRYLGIK